MRKIKSKNVSGGLSAFQDISLPGIKSLTDRRQPVWLKIVWSLIFLICTGLCIFQVTERICFFLTYPVNLMYELKNLETQRIPKISLCIDESERIRKGIYETRKNISEKDNDRNQAFLSNGETNALVWKITGSSLPDTVSFCTYSGQKPCLLPEYWHEQLTPSGRCYTLDVGNTFDAAGISSGFRIKMAIPEQSTRLSMNRLKWKVLLHDDLDNAKYEILLNSIPLYNLTMTTIIYTYKQFLVQNVPKRPCFDKKIILDCWLTCTDQIFLEKYNCRLPFMKSVNLPPCDESVDMSEAEVLAHNYDLTTCNCEKACLEESYDIQVDTRREVETTLRIIQGREEMEVFEEKRAYVLYALICEIGGILGLYLGACLLTFVEIFDVLLLVTCKSLIERNKVRPIKPKSLEIKTALVHTRNIRY